jgi:hypothetical protein
MRQTVKYKAAVKVAQKSGLMDWATQAGLYELLQCNGHMWDSKTGEWLHLPSMEADEPSPLIKVRAWAELGNVEAVSSCIANLMGCVGYELAEKSKVFPCRPPKQLEGRVYLTFLPNK